MHTTYLIGFQVRDGQHERFLELLNALLDAMRHEKTFVNATLHRDGENENRFLLMRPGATIRTCSMSRFIAPIVRHGTMPCPSFWKPHGIYPSGIPCGPLTLHR